MGLLTAIACSSVITLGSFVGLNVLVEYRPRTTGAVDLRMASVAGYSEVATQQFFGQNAHDSIRAATPERPHYKITLLARFLKLVNKGSSSYFS